MTTFIAATATPNMGKIIIEIISVLSMSAKTQSKNKFKYKTETIKLSIKLPKSKS